MALLHELAGGLLGEDADGSEVLAGIETDHGPWVTALVAAGYRVFPVSPQQSARSRARHAVSGAKSDAGDAHVLADMVRTDSHQLREAAGDSPEAAGIPGAAQFLDGLTAAGAEEGGGVLTGQLRGGFPPRLVQVGTGPEDLEGLRVILATRDDRIKDRREHVTRYTQPVSPRSILPCLIHQA
jgi:transposase